MKIEIMMMRKQFDIDVSLPAFSFDSVREFDSQSSQFTLHTPSQLNWLHGMYRYRVYMYLCANILLPFKIESKLKSIDFLIIFQKVMPF